METITIDAEYKEDLKIISNIIKMLKLKGKINIKKNLSSRTRKTKLVSEIEAGLKDVKLMQENKLKKKTLNQLINDK